jgi:hypothetical protein
MGQNILEDSSPLKTQLNQPGSVKVFITLVPCGYLQNYSKN